MVELGDRCLMNTRNPDHHRRTFYLVSFRFAFHVYTSMVMIIASCSIEFPEISA